MARQKTKACVVCRQPFEGRPNAKTCSVRCRKRLSRARQVIAHEAYEVKTTTQHLKDLTHETLKDLESTLTSHATQEGFVASPVAQPPVSPTPPPTLPPTPQPLQPLPVSPPTSTPTPQPTPQPPAPTPTPPSSPPLQAAPLAESLELPTTPTAHTPGSIFTPTVSSQPEATAGFTPTTQPTASPLTPEPSTPTPASSLFAPTTQVQPQPLSEGPLLSNASIPTPDFGYTPSATPPTTPPPLTPVATGPTPPKGPRFSMPRLPRSAKLAMASTLLICLIGIGTYLLGNQSGQQKAHVTSNPPTTSAQAVLSGNAADQSIHLNRATFIDGGNSFTASGPSTFKNLTNSTDAFSVQDATSADVLVVDTLNSIVGINTTPVAGAGSLQVGGNVNITGTFLINGQPISSANLANSANVTTQGNSFNGPSQLVQLDSSGILPVLNGSHLTNVNAVTLQGNGPSYYTNASNISTGTLSDARLSTNVTLDNANNTLSGNNSLTGTNSFTNPANSFSGDGANLTNLNATNLASGTVNDARLSSNVPLKNANNTFTGTNTFNGQSNFNGMTIQNGNFLFQSATNSVGAFAIQNAAGNDNLLVADTINTRIGIGVPAPNYTLDVNGDVNIANGQSYRINGVVVCNNVGCTPTGGSNQYVQLQASTPGTAQTGNANISGAIIAGSLAGSGLGLTNLDASQVAQGTLNNLRLSPSVTLQGNTFNGASQLVQTTSLSYLPALNGSLITNLNGSAVTTGTVADNRLSANVALLGATTQTFTGANTFSQLITAPGLETVNNTHTVSLGFSGTASANTSFGFNLSAGSGTQTICTVESGNCAGSGGGVTAGGTTTGYVPKFSPNATTLGNSLIYDNGTNIYVNETSDLNAQRFNVAGGIQSTTGIYVGGVQVCSATGCGASSATAIQNGTARQTSANFFIQSSNSSAVTGILEGASGQTADILDVQAFGGGTKYFAVNTSGATVAGNLSVSGVYQVGGVQISSANLSNDSNLAKLSATQTFSGNNTFTGTVTIQPAIDTTSIAVVQNHAGTSNLLIADSTNTRIGIGKQPSYTLDVNGSVNIASGQTYNINGTPICGPSTTCAPSSGSSAYIQNSVAVQTSANFNIESTATGSIVGVLKGKTGQTADILDLKDGSGNLITTIGNNGQTIFKDFTAGSHSYFQLQSANFTPNLLTADTITGQILLPNATLSSTALLLGGDANLYRSAASTLKTDGNFTTAGNQLVSGTTTLNGTVLAQNTVNSTTAFQVQNSSGASVLTADTSNMRLGVNVSFAAMSTPTGLTVGAASSGGSLSASTTYYYKVTAIDSAGGETTASTEASGATGIAPNQTLPVSWTAVTGASGYKVYRSTTTNTEVYLTTVTNNSFTDNGSILIGSGSPPSTSKAVVSSNNSNSQLQVSIGGNGSPTGQLYVGGILPASALSTTPLGSSIFGAWAVQTQGRYAYVTNQSTGGMTVYDVNTPAGPVKVGYISIPGATELALAGRYAYVATGSTLQIVDISNPASPANLGSVAVGSPWDVVVQGRYAYVTDSGANVLKIVDVSNPSAPLVVSSIAAAAGTEYVYVQGYYAYVTNYSGSAVKIYNVSNPLSPSLVSTYTTAGGAVGIYVVGRYAYVADYSTNYIEAVDISNPSSPTFVSKLALAAFSNPWTVVARDRYLYVTNNSTNTLQIIDISNPAAMRSIGTVPTGSSPQGLTVKGRYAYVANNSNSSLSVYDLGGAYSQQLEAGDAEIGSLNVDSNANFAGDATIAGGLQIGQGLQVSGNLSASSNLFVQGSTSFAGGILGGMTVNSLTTPSAPTVTPKGVAGTQRWDYTVTALSASGGETMASTAGTTSTGNATLTASNYNQLTWTSVSGAIAYKVYRTYTTGATSPTTTGLIGTAYAPLFNDTGLAGSGGSPTVDTTGNVTFNSSNTITKSTTNSTTAFQIQNSSAQNLFQTDTTNMNITLDGANTGQIGAWSTNTNALPQSLDGQASVVANGYVYVFGGQNNPGVYSTVYYAKLNANGSTGTWSTNNYALPQAVYGQSAVVANGYVYLMGGDNGNNYLSTVYYAKLNADGSTGPWITSPNALPQILYAPSSVVANGYVYVLGGVNNASAGGTSSTVYYAKLNADGSIGSWVTNPQALPQSRFGQSSVLANGYVYVIGGANNSSGLASTVYYAKLNADGTTGSWTTSSNPLPITADFQSSVTANGYVYVFAPNVSSTVYYAKLNADGSNGSWTTSANPLPQSLFNTSSVLANGYVYVLGGSGNSNGSSASNTVYYASTSRVQVAGSIDLVGLTGQTLADEGSGGSITAGDITAVGKLNVTNQANFTRNVSIGGDLSVSSSGGVSLATDSANLQAKVTNLLATGTISLQGPDGGSILLRTSANSGTGSNAMAFSGNEITDTTRSADTQGDGRQPPDSSTGVWESTTNMESNGGFESNTTNWNDFNALGATLSRDTSKAKFGNASLKVVTTAVNNNEGANHNWISMTVGVKYTLSAWVWAPVGSTLTLAINQQGGGMQGWTNFTGIGAWQKESVTVTPNATTNYGPQILTNGAQAITFWVDGVQVEQKGYATPYVETNGTTAARNGAGAQFPASLLSTSTSWFAARLREGSSSTNGNTVFEWHSSPISDEMSAIWNGSTNNWQFKQWVNGVGQVASLTQADTFTPGRLTTVIFAWDASHIYLSVDGSTFASAARSAIQTSAINAVNPYIGSYNNGSIYQWNGDILWTAAGTGTLSNADATSLYKLGNSDPTISSLNSIDSASTPTFAWDGESTQYSGTNNTPTLQSGITIDDVNLFRNSAGVLRTNGSLTVDNAISAGSITSVANINLDTPGSGYKLLFGPSGGDTNLYRLSSGVLKTDGSFQAATGLSVLGGNALSLVNASGNSTATLQNAGTSGNSVIQSNVPLYFAGSTQWQGGQALTVMGTLTTNSTYAISIANTIQSSLNLAVIQGEYIHDTISGGTQAVNYAGISINPTDNNTFADQITGIAIDVSHGTNASATRYAATLQGGNVGIGTSSPNAPLAIVSSGLGTAGGDINIFDSAANSGARINLCRDSGCGNELVLERLNSGATGTTWGIANADLGVLTNSAVGALAIGTDGAYPLYFATNHTVAITIDTSGNSTFAGNITVNGALITPTSSMYGSTLPVSPVNGQEFYYVADATNGIVWHLRYNSSEATYKWEYLGGASMVSQGNASTSISGGFTSMGGASITVPRTGMYVVRGRLNVFKAATTNGDYIYVSYQDGHNAASAGFGSYYTRSYIPPIATSAADERDISFTSPPILLTAGDTGVIQAYESVAGDTSALQEYLEIQPVRIN